jgi:hypothetical protein
MPFFRYVKPEEATGIVKEEYALSWSASPTTWIASPTV